MCESVRQKLGHTKALLGSRGVKNVNFCLLLGHLHMVRLHFYRILLYLYRGRGSRNCNFCFTVSATFLIKQRGGDKKAWKYAYVIYEWSPKIQRWSAWPSLMSEKKMTWSCTHHLKFSPRRHQRCRRRRHKTRKNAHIQLLPPHLPPPPLLRLLNLSPRFPTLTKFYLDAQAVKSFL